MSANVRASLKKSFINHRQLKVLVLSYLTSNGSLNLHYNCGNSIMVEQGTNYSMKHQAWLRVRQIGQQNTQRTTGLVNLAPIARLIVNTQRM